MAGVIEISITKFGLKRKHLGQWIKVGGQKEMGSKSLQYLTPLGSKPRICIYLHGKLSQYSSKGPCNLSLKDWGQSGPESGWLPWPVFLTIEIIIEVLLLHKNLCLGLYSQHFPTLSNFYTLRLPQRTFLPEKVFHVFFGRCHSGANFQKKNENDQWSRTNFDYMELLCTTIDLALLRFDHSGVVYNPELSRWGVLHSLGATSLWGNEHIALSIHFHTRFSIRSFHKYVCVIYSFLTDDFVFFHKTMSAAHGVLSPGLLSVDLYVSLGVFSGGNGSRKTAVDYISTGLSAQPRVSLCCSIGHKPWHIMKPCGRWTKIQWSSQFNQLTMANMHASSKPEFNATKLNRPSVAKQTRSTLNSKAGDLKLTGSEPTIMVVDDSAETSAEIARLDLMESPLSIKEAIFVEEHTSEALSGALGQFQSLRGKAKSARNRRRIAIDSFQRKIKDEPLPVQPLCHVAAHGTIITVDEALTILRERSEDDIKGNWQDAEAFLDIIQAWRDDATEENTDVQEEEAASVTPGKRSIEQVGDTEADEASLLAALLLRLPSLQDGLRELELDICEWGYYREEYYHRQVEADRLFDNHCEPMVTDMIMLFMIPVGIPPDCLYDIIQVMEHVRSLGIDLVQAESMVCDDEWRYMVTGRSCAMFLRLKRPREFEDGSSPLSTTLPRNFLHQDVLRVPHLDEKSGNKPSRLTLGCTAVSPSWRNPDHPTNEIAVLRGIHCDQGYFEASMAAATAMVCSSTLNTMQLHPEIELHLTPSFRRVFKKPTEAEVTQGLYKIGLEITLLIRVDCLPTLAQDECLKKQLLDNLGMNHTAQGRKQWSERERSGNNFMLCASTLTPEYSNNYPAIMLRPSPGQITVITNLRSG
jgi:hypothetical protein